MASIDRAQVERAGGVPAKRKQTGSHFTPKPLADLVAERLAGPVARLDRPLRILDPACGDGNLLIAMAEALPADVLRRCTLVGVEQDSGAHRILTTRLGALGLPRTELIRGDFLDFLDDRSGDGARVRLQPADVVIANPPYVRTQLLGSDRARQLAARFGLRGRIDLYQAFLVAMADVLRPGGQLGVITSNRFLTTRGGAVTRALLRSQFDLSEVVDLGDTKLFDAAVLPAVIFGSRREHPREAPAPMASRFLRVYSLPQADTAAIEVASVPSALRGGADGRYRVDGTTFEVARGGLHAPADPKEPWTMQTAGEAEWIRRIDQHADGRLGDFAKVRVGIKTTADRVFIRDDWDRVPLEYRPEPKYLKRLLSRRNAARWCTPDNRGRPLRVLYTHQVCGGRRRAVDFPEHSRAWRYLLSHRQRLEARPYVAAAGRRWYEIWVPQDPAAWQLPKIVFPDISPDARFFLDTGGSVVDGNCYWITTHDPDDEDLLLLILAVANSATMARYHELAFQNRLYAHRRRYLTQYVERYPLPDRRRPECAQIIALARQLTETPLTETPIGNTPVEQQIDQLVRRAFRIQSQSPHSSMLA